MACGRRQRKGQGEHRSREVWRAERPASLTDCSRAIGGAAATAAANAAAAAAAGSCVAANAAAVPIERQRSNAPHSAAPSCGWLWGRPWVTALAARGSGGHSHDVDSSSSRPTTRVSDCLRLWGVDAVRTGAFRCYIFL
jgi:hypothetical protein